MLAGSNETKTDKENRGIVAEALSRIEVGVVESGGGNEKPEREGGMRGGILWCRVRPIYRRPFSMLPVSSATRALIRATRDSIAMIVLVDTRRSEQRDNSLSSPLVSPSSVLVSVRLRSPASSEDCLAALSAAFLRICAHLSPGLIGCVNSGPALSSVVAVAMATGEYTG